MADLPPWRVPRLMSGNDDLQVLDLTHVEFVKPRGIVAIATQVEAMTRQGVAVRVIAPASADTGRYLSRAHLPHQLDELGVAHNFSTVREHDLGRSLVELTRFSNNHDVVALADSVRGDQRRTRYVLAHWLIGSLAHSYLVEGRSPGPAHVARLRGTTVSHHTVSLTLSTRLIRSYIRMCMTKTSRRLIMESMTRRAPGVVRDAVLASFRAKPVKAEMTVAEIHARVTDALGAPVAASSVRSYLNLNTPGVFLRTSRATYRLVRK